MRLMLAAATLFSIGGAVVSGGRPAQGTGREIIPAVRGTRNEICFDLPAGLVDWRVIAARTLGARAISKPDTGELRRNAFESATESTILFEARTPPAVESRGWLLVHDRGASPLPPVILRGTVKYTIRADSIVELVGDPRMSGRACARVPANGERPAFILSGVPSTGWTATDVSAQSVIIGDYPIVVDGKRYNVRRSEIGAPRMRRMLLLRQGAARPLLLVAWEAESKCDRSCCDGAFDLFEVEPDKLTPLAQNAATCDP